METIKPHTENINNNPDTSPSSSETSVQPPRFLGTTNDQKTVYSLQGSHFHAEDGITYETLEEAIPNIDTKDKELVNAEVEFNRTIGIDKCVSINPNDEVIMVYRKGRMGQTPMVKNREPEQSNLLQVLLRKSPSNPNEYTLVTTFVGKSAPREPWDPSIETEEEREKCANFWGTHALIYNEDLIDWERTPK